MALHYLSVIRIRARSFSIAILRGQFLKTLDRAYVLDQHSFLSSKYSPLRRDISQARQYLLSRLRIGKPLE